MSLQQEKAEHQRALQTSEARCNQSLWLEAESGQIKLKITCVSIRVSLIAGTGGGGCILWLLKSLHPDECLSGDSL